MFTEEQIKELEPAPKPIMDLSLFIKAAKQEGYKIGWLGEDVKKGFTTFIKGQFILYRPYTANEAYGRMLYDDVKFQCQMCTTCMPYERDGKIYTASSCVCVPLKIISYEIKFE